MHGYAPERIMMVIRPSAAAIVPSKWEDQPLSPYVSSMDKTLQHQAAVLNERYGWKKDNDYVVIHTLTNPFIFWYMTIVALADEKVILNASLPDFIDHF